MSLFESRLLAEGLRSIEGESPTRSTFADKPKATDFESLILQRAAYDTNSENISVLFLRFRKVVKNLYVVLALLLFGFGAIAVNKLLFSEQLTSINFFWAFALFFIPNILMFVVWSVIFIRPTLLQNSSLTRFSLVLIKAFERRFNKADTLTNNYLSLFNCYFRVHFDKQIGRYQLSKLTHLLWLSYFSGAALMSLLMLATHQVDFVWQTSILSSDSFQALTKLLAYLPQQLGFAVPSSEQIQHSYLGSTDLLDAENRRLVWSSLLISSLLLYGLLPRLFLYLLMAYKLKQQKLRFRLELSLPYYVQLRQILKPNKTTLGITDVDVEEVRSQANPLANESAKEGVLPKDFYPVAIELSTTQFSLVEQHLLQLQLTTTNTIINACDYQTQQQLLQNLKLSESRTVVLYVALSRLPDRGLKRFISVLTSLPNKRFYLALIVENKENRQRDSDWYQLANNVAIELDNIVHIEVQGN